MVAIASDCVDSSENSTGRALMSRVLSVQEVMSWPTTSSPHNAPGRQSPLLFFLTNDSLHGVGVSSGKNTSPILMRFSEPTHAASTLTNLNEDSWEHRVLQSQKLMLLIMNWDAESNLRPERVTQRKGRDAVKEGTVLSQLWLQ